MSESCRAFDEPSVRRRRRRGTRSRVDGVELERPRRRDRHFRARASWRGLATDGESKV